MSKRTSNAAPPLRLLIEPVVGVAEAPTERVKTELPTHDGLATAAEGVAAAAPARPSAFRRAMKARCSLHRLPAVFLAAALVCLVVWLYWRFFHVATLTVAMPDRDATELREPDRRPAPAEPRRRESCPARARRSSRSPAGEVDLAFVQGGLAIPPDLPRLETPSPEVVLWSDAHHVRRPQREAHSHFGRGEGSHTVAEAVRGRLGHRGRSSSSTTGERLTADPNFILPPTSTRCSS